MKPPSACNNPWQTESVKLSSAVLAKYVGTYESKDGTKVTMALSGELLFMGSFPMVAMSETLFESADSNVEFIIGPDGKVTHFIDHAVEGDVRFDRKP